MTPQIKYVVGDRRRKPIPVTPCIIIGNTEFVATESTTMQEAQQLCRALVSDPHTLHEQYTKKYHEEVDVDELMRDIRSYDE